MEQIQNTDLIVNKWQETPGLFVYCIHKKKNTNCKNMEVGISDWNNKGNKKKTAAKAV